jgi:hypothetical protein
MTFDRNIAFHEAGHAVAYCVFSSGSLVACVFDPADKRADPDTFGACVPAVPFSGFMEECGAGNVHDFVGLSDAQREAIIEDGLRDIVCTFAGPVAEARARGMGPTAFPGGSSDFEQACAIAKFIAPGKAKKVLTYGKAVADAWVHLEPTWELIEAVAALLMRDGHIDGALLGDAGVDSLALPDLERFLRELRETGSSELTIALPAPTAQPT